MTHPSDLRNASAFYPPQTWNSWTRRSSKPAPSKNGTVSNIVQSRHASGSQSIQLKKSQRDCVIPDQRLPSMGQSGSDRGYPGFAASDFFATLKAVASKATAISPLAHIRKLAAHFKIRPELFI